MSRFTRGTTALTLVCVAGLLVGCDRLNPSRGAGGNIKFSSWGAPKDFAIYREIFNKFESENPGHQVLPLYMPFDSYFTKLQLLLVGRVGPDVALVNSPMAYQLMLNRHIQSLQPYIERERETDPGFLTEEQWYIDMLKPAATLGGEFYYLPIGPMTMHVYYNKTLFDAAGVSYPQKGWTWDDFREAAKRLTIRKDGRFAQCGLVVYNWDTWWRLFLLQNGTDIFDDPMNPKRCLLDSPAAVETFRFLQDLIYKDLCAVTQTEAGEIGADFLTGRLAMTIHGTWMLEQYRQIRDFEWDIAPLPMRKQYANIVTVCGVSMASATRDKEAAWRFMRYLVSDESQRIMSSECATWQPTSKRLANLPYVHDVPGLPEHDSLRFTELDRAVPGAVLRHPNAPELLDLLFMGVEPIFQGKQTPEECLPVVTEKVNAFLAAHPSPEQAVGLRTRDAKR